MKLKTIGGLLLTLPLAILASGCIPMMTGNALEREARAKKLGQIAVMNPKVEICEINAGGIEEKRDDWCEMGRKNLEEAVVAVLTERGVRIKPLKTDASGEKEIKEDIHPLYQAVMHSIYAHTEPGTPNFFPEKLQKFDYSVGSLEKLLKNQKADGLIIVYGSDEISTAGRKALQVVQAINPFGTMQRSGVTWAQIALADRSGDILWYSSMGNAGGYDLREPGSARDFVEKLLKDYPGGN